MEPALPRGDHDRPGRMALSPGHHLARNRLLLKQIEEVRERPAAERVGGRRGGPGARESDDGNEAEG